MKVTPLLIVGLLAAFGSAAWAQDDDPPAAADPQAQEMAPPDDPGETRAAPDDQGETRDSATAQPDPQDPGPAPETHHGSSFSSLRSSEPAVLPQPKPKPPH